MSIEVDPESNPLLTGVDNPGYDETGEQMEMGNLNQYYSVDPTGLNKKYETPFGGEPSEQEKK